MRGILIQQPFASSIIKGSKKTEYRKYKLPDMYLHRAIYLLSKGKVLGKIILSWKSTHKNDHRYKIFVEEIFEPPKNYVHPKGAQRYVKKVSFR